MANTNTKPYEIVAGPMDVYYAPTGTSFPAADALDTPGTEWTKVGFTEGGVKVANPQNVVELRADQVTGPIKAVRSEEGLEITFDIASLKLENHALALNRALSGPDTGSGNKSVPLYRGGFLVETLAILCRNEHTSPYGDKPLQFECPVAFQAGAPEETFTKDNKAVLAVSFHALVDPERETDDESFGRVRAGD